MEQQAVSLKQCISEITGKQIAMIGKDFIYLDDKTKIESEVINEANILAFKKMKDNKIEMLATTYRTESTKNITYKNVVYKGGESSASAIAGAVTLAKSLQELEVKIIDINDDENFMSFDEALQLSGMIAKSWRDAFFRYKELKRQISNAATVEELDLISWEEV